MTEPTDRRSFLKVAGVSALAANAYRLEAQPAGPIRLAIVGTGRRGWGHLSVLATLPQYEVVALADPTPENLAHAAGLAPGAKAYADYRDLLRERGDLEAVVVVTPSFLHAEATIAALQRGLHVLCEKPMATTVQDATRMIEASRKAGKLLHVGFQKRFVPATAKMHELAAAGELGRIQLVSANLFRGDWNPASWKYTAPGSGVKTNWRHLTFTAGSALLEDGIHELDALGWMIDAPVSRVTASGGNNVFKERETIDHAAVIVEYESGVKLSFDFCLFAPQAGPAARRVVLIGSEGVMQPEEGRVAIRSRAGAVRYFDVEGTASKEGPAAREARDSETRKQYLAFAAALRSGAALPVAPEAGRLAVKLALLAETSLRTRRSVGWTELPERA